MEFRQLKKLDHGLHHRMLELFVYLPASSIKKAHPSWVIKKGTTAIYF